VKAAGFFADVACDDSVATLGSDGVLLGWHSFDGESGEAILPEVTVAKASDGTAWVTHVEGCSVDLAPPSDTAPRATQFTVQRIFAPLLRFAMPCNAAR
jgi:hypothetical protein